MTAVAAVTEESAARPRRRGPFSSATSARPRVVHTAGTAATKEASRQGTTLPTAGRTRSGALVSADAVATANAAAPASRKHPTERCTPPSAVFLPVAICSGCGAVVTADTAVAAAAKQAVEAATTAALLAGVPRSAGVRAIRTARRPRTRARGGSGRRLTARRLTERFGRGTAELAAAARLPPPGPRIVGLW